MAIGRPVAAVNGNLSLLEMSFDTTNPRAGVVNDVMNTARRGLELSEKLQAFAGRQRLQRTRLDLNQIAAATVAGLKQTLLRDMDVELELSPDGLWISSDAEKLQHVIEELAKNAVAAMASPHQTQGWMIVMTDSQEVAPGQADSLPAGEYAVLSVKDAGEGMTPDVARRAMDPLFSTRPGHHGWGLARCAGFVRQCGGAIVLDSAPGKGTTVDIYLPLAR